MIDIANSDPINCLRRSDIDIQIPQNTGFTGYFLPGSIGIKLIESEAVNPELRDSKLIFRLEDISIQSFLINDLRHLFPIY